MVIIYIIVNHRVSRHLLARQKLLISPRFLVVPNLFATKYSKHNRINALLTSFAQPRNYFNLTKRNVAFYPSPIVYSQEPVYVCVCATPRNLIFTEETIQRRTLHYATAVQIYVCAQLAPSIKSNPYKKSACSIRYLEDDSNRIQIWLNLAYICTREVL